MTEKELAPDGAFCIVQTTEEYLDRSIDLEIEISDKLKLLRNEDVLRIVQQETVPRLKTYSEAAAYTKDLRIESAKNIKERNMTNPDYVPIERFSTEMGVDGMVHIIRDKGTVDSAYDIVSELYSREVDQLKEMATKEHYNRREILEHTALLLPTEINRIKQEKLYSKIPDKTTINSMFDNTYEAMVVLGELDSLRKKVMELEARQTISEIRIDAIGEYLNGDSKLDIKLANKQAALKLKAQGLNNKRIAAELKVSTKTVSRWLKELNHNTL